MNDLMDIPLEEVQRIVDNMEIELPKKRNREKWADRVKRIKKQLYEEMFPMVGDKIKIYNWREDNADEGIIDKYIYGIVNLIPEWLADECRLEIGYTFDMDCYTNEDFPICSADTNNYRTGTAVFNSTSLEWEDSEL